MDTDRHRWGGHRSLLVLGVCFLLYVFSYVLNSFFGGYWMRPEMDGRNRYSFGLAMPTAFMWQPFVGHQAIGNYDLVGIFYKPLIQVDRRYIHRTMYLSDEVLEKIIPSLKATQVHPYWRDEFSTRISAVATRDEPKRIIRCAFHYAGSNHLREIVEIKMQRKLADSLGVSSPDGFVEKPYEGRQEHLNTNYIRWSGKLILLKDQDITLQFPIKQLGTNTGRIVFYYQRTDDPSQDFKNFTSVEFK
jgi:hypothetical protein